MSRVYLGMAKSFDKLAKELDEKASPREIMARLADLMRVGSEALADD